MTELVSVPTIVFYPPAIDEQEYKAAEYVAAALLLREVELKW